MWLSSKQRNSTDVTIVTQLSGGCCCGGCCSPGPSGAARAACMRANGVKMMAHGGQQPSEAGTAPMSPFGLADPTPAPACPFRFLTCPPPVPTPLYCCAPPVPQLTGCTCWRGSAAPGAASCLPRCTWRWCRGRSCQVGGRGGLGWRASACACSRPFSSFCLSAGGWLGGRGWLGEQHC